VKMRQSEIVYQDRTLKITKYPTDKGNKYKIEMTIGRFCRSWEEYFTTNEQVIESSKRRLKRLYKHIE